MTAASTYMLLGTQNDGCVPVSILAQLHAYMQHHTFSVRPTKTTPNPCQHLTSFVERSGVLLKQAAERRRTSYEREFHARLRPLARYQPQPDHEVFVEGLLLEARLRARILVRAPVNF